MLGASLCSDLSHLLPMLFSFITLTHSLEIFILLIVVTKDRSRLFSQPGLGQCRSVTLLQPGPGIKVEKLAWRELDRAQPGSDAATFII